MKPTRADQAAPPPAAAGPGRRALPTLFLRSARRLPLCCPLALMARAFGPGAPSWAFAGPSQGQHAAPVREVVGLWPVAGKQYRGGSLATFEQGLAELAARTESLGPPPPLGWATWPEAGLALPFFAGTAAWARATAAELPRPVPWARAPQALEPALGGWRAFALTLAVAAGRAGNVLVAIWLGRLPAGAHGRARRQQQRAELLRQRDDLLARCQAAAGELAAEAAARAAKVAAAAAAPAGAEPNAEGAAGAEGGGSGAPAAGRRAEPPAAAVQAVEPGARATFMARVERARLAIGAGQLAKVVLARFARFAAPDRRAKGGFDVLSTLQALRAQHPAAYVFCWQVREGAYFVGASPERLLDAQRGRATTHAVAGTAIDEASAGKLLGQAKDLAEHRYVVDALVAAVAPACRRVRVAPRPQLLRAGKLWHLETPLWLQLAGSVTPLALAGRLHPTPALAGTPVADAAEYLADPECWRGLYGGLVGPWAPTSLTLAVSIRSALVTESRAWCFAGAGIVWQSIAADEWREVAAKLDSAAAALTFTATGRPAQSPLYPSAPTPRKTDRCGSKPSN